MIYESEILTSWCAKPNEQQITWVPFAAHCFRIPNWVDATGAARVPCDPNVLVIRTLTDQPIAEIIPAGDPLNAILWTDPVDDLTERRRFCTLADRDRFAQVIDRMAGREIGRDVVGGDVLDMALTVVSWRIKMWIRTLAAV
jgi:hypothetical protein